MDKITLERINDNYKVYGLNTNFDERIRYIGITSKSIEHRVNGHIRDVKRNNVNTYKKHWISKCINNLNTIGHVLLEDGLTQKEAFSKEVEYIKLFKSLGANLVNGTVGGDGIVITDEIRRKMRKRKGFKHTQDAKNKMSAHRIGKRLSEETKKRMSNTHKRIGTKPFVTLDMLKRKSEMMRGKASAMKGKKHSEETIIKISKTKTGVPSNKVKPISKYDINMNFINAYPSITMAVIETGINNIYRCAIGGRKTAGGYIWKFN